MSHFNLEPVLEHYGVSFTPGRMSWMKVLCPVHEETRPSCSINLETNYFECFSCGASGHTIDLVMLKENCERQTAAAFCENVPGSRNDDVPGGPARGGWRGGKAIPGGPRYRPKYAGGWRSR